MSWHIEIPNRVRKELLNLPAKDAQKVATAIDTLAEDPRPPGSKKLEDSEDWRIRVGDYRVIYEIHETILIVKVVRVGHRKNVYRKR